MMKFGIISIFVLAVILQFGNLFAHAQTPTETVLEDIIRDDDVKGSAGDSNGSGSHVPHNVYASADNTTNSTNDNSTNDDETTDPSNNGTDDTNGVISSLSSSMEASAILAVVAALGITTSYIV